MLVCLDQRNGSGCGATNRDNAKHCTKCGMSLRYALMLQDPGALIDRYEIESIIGYGGFGAVYHAKDTRTGQEVALKETFDPASTRAFQGEFAKLHHLEHDHLPNYYAMFEADGNGYLVMELIPGQSLLDVLQRRQGKPLAEAQVLGYAHQLCDALIYLHQQNPPLIHRDIKPANIRLTPDGLIKLVDFGLLKQGTDKTGSSRMGLTPAYAPLEQWGGMGLHTTPQSDLYSLGATLYHLLTGRAPTTVTDRIAATDDPLVPPIQINSRISPHVSDAIIKALAIRPSERFADAAMFKQALISPVPTTDPYKTVVQQPTPPLPPHPVSYPQPTPPPQQVAPALPQTVSEPTQVAPTQVASQPNENVSTRSGWWDGKWWGLWVAATALGGTVGWWIAKFVSDNEHIFGFNSLFLGYCLVPLGFL